MSEQGPDPSLLIGLHKLAAQNGEGLVPELYALLADPRLPESGDTNVVPFPSGQRSTSPSHQDEATGRILTFRR